MTSKKGIHELPPVKIRTEALDWRLSQLPFSTRLARALRRLGFERLGELDGMNFQRLLSQRNCGVATVVELVKVLRLVESGDFDLAGDPDRPDGLRHLVRHIDSVLETLPSRKLQILLMRLGGIPRRGKASTLQEIGNRFKLTREGARQIFCQAIGRVLKSCGPPGILLLQNLRERCLESVCPLTAEPLNSFLGPAPSHRYALSFYLRLFKELDPRIPAWPDGQESGHSVKGRQN
ncbi:MAG: sigma factor-like helix-turn-helix DNA-binding protein, partial [Terriglobia bacterium]